MHLQSIFKVISFFAVGQVLIRALPTDEIFPGLDSLDSLIVPCNDISKYTVQWFRGNYCKRPPAATYLFYTRGLSKTAQRFAQADPENNLTTIWELWDTKQYDDRVQNTKKSLRCIMQYPAKRKIYFRNMSEAMAAFCDVFAQVMDKNYPDVRLDGIWGQIELPTLQKLGNDGVVFQIDAISQDGKQVRPYWVRGSIRKTKRQDTGQVAPCGAGDDTPAIFDEGGALPVDW